MVNQQSENFGTDEAAGVIGDLRSFFDTGTTGSIEWRLEQLTGLEHLLEREELRIEAALATDLGKPPNEGWLSEIMTTAGELRELKHGLRRWARQKRVRIPIAFQPGKASLRMEPLGVVMVIAPWNYPFNLVMAPTAAAIAAGNCVVVKPSELAPATAALLAELLPRYIDSRVVRVVEGGSDVTQSLLRAKVDHVFFTGSNAVGRLVMETAARSLTPVTLELGGKSPAIVDDTADLSGAAERIAWGKFLNAGQTCIAPDYVLVQKDVAEEFMKRLTKTIDGFYGSDPQKSESFARIVNDAHLERLSFLLQDHGGTVEVGGTINQSDRYVAPTVISNPSLGSPLMSEEIFGPLLPVISFSTMSDAVDLIRSRPAPLTMYVFSKNQIAIDAAMTGIRSGSVCINTTLEQFGIPQLPFGGVGNSGVGSYHGRFGFVALSHQRAVFRRPARLPMQILYPPYKKWKRSLLKKVL